MKKNNDQWKLEEMEVTVEDKGKANDVEINDTEETLNDE
jgi:hypothetical protein